MKIFVRINGKRNAADCKQKWAGSVSSWHCSTSVIWLTLRIKVIYSKLPLLARDDTQLRDSIKEVCVAALWCLIFQLISQEY